MFLEDRLGADAYLNAYQAIRRVTSVRYSDKVPNRWVLGTVVPQSQQIDLLVAIYIILLDTGKASCEPDTAMAARPSVVTPADEQASAATGPISDRAKTATGAPGGHPCRRLPPPPPPPPLPPSDQHVSLSPPPVPPRSGAAMLAAASTAPSPARNPTDAQTKLVPEAITPKRISAPLAPPVGEAAPTSAAKTGKSGILSALQSVFRRDKQKHSSGTPSTVGAVQDAAPPAPSNRTVAVPVMQAPATSVDQHGTVTRPPASNERSAPASVAGARPDEPTLGRPVAMDAEHADAAKLSARMGTAQGPESSVATTSTVAATAAAAIVQTAAANSAPATVPTATGPTTATAAPAMPMPMPAGPAAAAIADSGQPASSSASGSAVPPSGAAAAVEPCGDVAVSDDEDGTRV